MITNSLQSSVRWTNQYERKWAKQRKLQGNKLTICARCSCRKQSWCWQIPGLSPWTLDRVVQSGGLLQNTVKIKGLVIYWTLYFHVGACQFPKHFCAFLLLSSSASTQISPIMGRWIRGFQLQMFSLLQCWKKESSRKRFCWVKTP